MRKTVLVVALILVGCALAFASGTPPKEKGAAAVAVSAPGQYPVVKEKVTLTAYIPSIGFIQDIKTNSSVLWLEQKTNVHVEWIETTKVDAKTRLSILLAGGDYPDMLVGTGQNGAGLSVQDVYRYGTQGVFIPLNDLIKRYGYFVTELFTKEPSVEPAITSPNGSIYGLPAVFTDDYHMTMRQKLWIEKNWLARLGLQMPTTTDDLYAVAKAFKEKDANGNGDPNDEIPLTGAKRSQEDLAMWIMNAYTPAGGPDDSGDALLNNYEFLVKGKVFFDATTSEFREGLRFINKLYTEKLIDVAALTQDKEQIKPLVDGGTVSRVGMAASHHPGNFAAMTDTSDQARYKQYVAVPPIKGPSGAQTTAWIIDGVIQPGQFEITSKCKNPEVAFRWADTTFSLDFGLKEKGNEGVHWSKADPSQKLIGLNGQPAKYVYGKVLAKEDNAQINLGQGWTRDLKNEFAPPGGTGYSYEQMLYNQTKLYEPYKVARFPYATASIAEKDMQEFNDLRRTIHTFVGESIDRFIIGDKSLDKDWDSYVAQLNQIGLPRFMEILEASQAAKK
jgi:putative aldouronate transport system substrate-binding protein